MAGTQGGKTSYGPFWLLDEIRRCGAGDYLVATPTFPLLEVKLLPEFLRLFSEQMNLGTYTASPIRKFVLSGEGEARLFGSEQTQPTRIIFGHAQDPDSLESATAKAAWLDEAGQKKFRLGSWEAIQRRLSIHRGRVLITTTPYTLGWLKTKLHDPAKAGADDIDLVQFESIQNPAFPIEEFEEQRAKLPAWKFNMMYRGLFERPAGMIYDVFDESRKVARFDIPDGWLRVVGLDFGGVNTVAVFLAMDPETLNLYAYREYKAGGRTAAGHAAHLKEPGLRRACGGSWSEGQWRDEFAAAGFPIQKPPIKDVEVGIDRVYSLLASGRLFVFDDLDGLINDLEGYSRVLDANGDPTEQIEDKASFHYCDALRYIASLIENRTGKRRRITRR